MTAHMTLLVATHNRGKVAELCALLAGLRVEIVSSATLLRSVSPPPEDGATFEENAVRKAKAAADASMLVTIADDSGLEVDALGGRPGVRSARFAGEAATDADNNAALLAALHDVDDEHRRARFRCALALVDPWSESDAPIVCEGRCEGTIARVPSGTGGFGYDPLFVVEGYGRTMAELSEAEKNFVSHRARAIEAMRPRLESLLGARIAHAASIASR